MGMESFIEQIFREFPLWLAIVMAVFLGILLIIWLLLPLWVLFIQWNTGKIKDEIRYLVDLLEKREWDEKRKKVLGPKDQGSNLSASVGVGRHELRPGTSEDSSLRER